MERVLKFHNYDDSASDDSLYDKKLQGMEEPVLTLGIMVHMYLLTLPLHHHNVHPWTMMSTRMATRKM